MHLKLGCIAATHTNLDREAKPKYNNTGDMVMKFNPYIYGHDDLRIPVAVIPMAEDDARKTEDSWQTSWASEYLADPRLEKYAVKLDDELIALGAYEVQESALVVHIVYMEAQPESNPTIAGKDRKYRGIGRLLIAFGIKLSVDNGFGGDVVLEAKTPELAKHYEKDFGAVRLPIFMSSAPRLLIADEAAKRIFVRYLE